jgi:hypothetical protein
MRKRPHPYTAYEKEAVWRVLDRGIEILAKNGDLKEQTARQYIVGYLAKVLVDEGFRQVSELRTGRRTLRVVEVEEPQRRAGAA